MELLEAVDRVLLGESIAQIARCYRDELLESFGVDPATADPQTFKSDTTAFVNKLCRQLGDRHHPDSRVSAALLVWAGRVEEYDAFDALLANFDRFEGRKRLVERGQRLFPGPLTAHWVE